MAEKTYDKKAFQSKANCQPTNSPCFIVNKFDLNISG